MNKLLFIKAGSLARVLPSMGATMWRELHPSSERVHLSQDELVFVLEDSDWPTMTRCATKSGAGFIDVVHIKKVNCDK